MFRKLILLLLAVTLLLAACKKKEEDTPTPEPVVETPTQTESTAAEPTSVPTEEPVEKITVRFAVNDFEQSMFNDIIDGFEADNPDIEIKLVSINEVLGLGAMGGEWPEDAMYRLATSADIINMDMGVQAIEDGLALDLSPFVDTDPSFDADDFYPGTLEDCQDDNGTWCLPTMVNFQLIFFDKDAFDAAGESYPAAGWTWDDMLDKAIATTERDGDEVTRWGFVLPWPDNMTYIVSRVGPLVNTATDPPTPDVDRVEVEDALRWYTDLFLTHEVAPYFAAPEEADGPLMPEGQVLIDDGQAAMWPYFSGAWSWLSGTRNLGVAPMPVDDDDSKTSPIYTEGISVSAGTANPQAAWRFINYLGQQTNEFFGLQSLPARRSTAEASGFWDEIDEELADALRFAVDHSYSGNWQPGYGAFADAVGQVLNEERSVEDVLADIETEMERQIAESMAEGDEEDESADQEIVVAPGEDEPEANPDAVTIVFTPGSTGSFMMQPYRDLAKSFQEEHPDIIVEVEQADFFGGEGIPSMPDMAANADCFVWQPTLQDPANLDAVLNLEPFLDADTAFDIDDFYSTLVELFTAQGQLWGLPASTIPYIIEYNKDLFDAAGLDYPPMDWTTEEFLATAVALTQGEDDEKTYGFVPQSYEITDMLLMLERVGAVMVDDSVDPPTMAFTDPSMADALRWYAGLDSEYGVKPSYVTDIADIMASTSAFMEREAVINEGRGAMWTNYATLDVMGERDLNIGAAPLPAGGGKPAGAFMSSEGYFISAHTEARQQCWAWITYLTSQPTAVQAMPARRSVAESDAFSQQVGADRAEAYLASIANAGDSSSFQFFENEDWMGYSLFWLGRAYKPVAEGEATAEEALKEAQKIFEDYRACIITNEGLTDEQVQEECAKEVDPSLPAFIFGN